MPSRSLTEKRTTRSRLRLNLCGNDTAETTGAREGLFRPRTAADDFHRKASRGHLPGAEGSYSTTDTGQVSAGTKDSSMAVISSAGDTN